VNVVGCGTVCLGGDLPSKLQAWRAAEGTGVEIWRDNLEGHRSPELRQALGSMKVINIQPLHNFAGVPPDKVADARTHASAFISEARYWDAAVLCCASTHLRTRPDLITNDLQDLAHWAGLAGVEIWYEALPWSRYDCTLPAAWERVQQVDRENVKLVIDTWHHLITGGDPGYVRRIPAARVGLVQLSDLAREEPTIEELIGVARNERALIGDGFMAKPMKVIVDTLLDEGYGGPISAEVMSRPLRATDPDTAAQKIMAALRQVVPTPS